MRCSRLLQLPLTQLANRCCSVDLLGVGPTQILTKLETVEFVLGQSEMDVVAFSRFAKRHPAMLYPAFQFQLTLRRRVLGEPYWARLAHARVDIVGGKQVQYGGAKLHCVWALLVATMHY